MPHARTRDDFQALALLRLAEAKGLLAGQSFEGTYYLCGYVVECGLKACIARRRMKAGTFPDRTFSKEVYTHDLERLVMLADLEDERRSWSTSQPKFGNRWAVVSRWNESSRYETVVEQKEAEELYEAVSAPKLGVLTWLKKYW